MQKIAMEMNLSETAFAVKKTSPNPSPKERNVDVYDIRFFTPEEEIALCGHATLSTAHILFTL
jgi:PhzF family phenazine biosynthesis protein